MRAIIITHEEKFLEKTLGPRLQIGLAALRAYMVFVIPDKAKRGQGRKSNNQVTRDVILSQGFEGWLEAECPWLKKPTAYKYMTALKGLGLDHTAAEREVAASLKRLLRKGPVSLKALCDAAVEAVAPKADPPRLEQSEFEFLRDSLAAYREQSEAVLALKSQLEASPDMYKAACARAYATLSALTGTDWKPSDEPDALASVNPDSISL
ncbi:MAG: hypothetical protein WCP45_15210 [Verrucomicrobiota bacterium]